MGASHCIRSTRFAESAKQLWTAEPSVVQIEVAGRCSAA
jgi:hypothetical protein